MVLRAADFSIERYDPARGSELRTVIPYEKRLLSDAEKQARVDSAHARGMAATGGVRTYRERVPGVRILTEVVRAAELPDALPPFVDGSAIAGPNNTVWISETGAGDDRDSVTVSIISTDPSSLGQRERIRVGPGTRIVGFGTHSVYTLETHSRLLARRTLFRR